MYRSISRLVGVASAALVCLTFAATAEAVPFTITSQLTGDFRADNPDNLFVNVTITGDTTSNVAYWVVDVNSPAHPDARLGSFAFNLATSFQFVSFSNFDPSDWEWSVTSGTNTPGSGSADFLFEANDPAGSSNNVTNNQTLSFRSTLLVGTWSEAMFLDAALSTGGGIPAPGAQLGAHLQSLSTSGCSGCSDSGFASGNYSGSTQVPEPTGLLLMGLGLAVASLRARRTVAQ